ncbi:hypothetical protein [Streptomyces odontomachi]|uniref:hypothetical protein n=1 Tax=Streptomyces odontomachi TaxID=2944940 RepID=UPI00210F193B|nr:hypothetical protein [Streptomyces sp. ODS25]
MSEASDLRRGAGALKTFKKRVDGVLDKLDGSPGSAKQVAQHELPPTALKGAGEFHEADHLYTQYARVHEELKHLSKMLGLQIEAMGIAVHGADIGYDNLDDDQRRRFHALQTQIQKMNTEDDHGAGNKSKNAGKPKDTMS